MEIGKNIKLFRKEKGLTQEYLADVVGVSAQAVSKWETGQAMPDVTLILPICSVLGVSADRLLGGNRCKELEKNFRESIPLGVDAELIACEEALREYPDDETFQYRMAVLEFFKWQEKKSRMYLDRSFSRFSRLAKKYPDDETYKDYLAQLHHALGRHEEAISIAKSCKNRDVLLDSILEGEELLRHRQRRVYNKINELIGLLREYGTKESLALEDEIRRLYFGEVGEYCCSRWFTYFKLAEIYLNEGDGEKYALYMEKAYELAKLEDENSKEPYSSVMTDRIKKHLSDPSEVDQFLSTVFAPNVATEFKKRIIKENYSSSRFYQQNARALIGFLGGRAHADDPTLVDYSTNWCMTQAEHDEFLNSYAKEGKKSNNASALLNVRSMQKALELIQKGKIGGVVASLGHLVFVGFCNCQAKTRYAALTIGEVERGIKTADCDDDKILTIVSLDIDASLKNCGIEERLIEDSCRLAKEDGFLYAETYIRYHDKNHKEELERYKSLGFYDVREFENEVTKGVILQKKL